MNTKIKLIENINAAKAALVLAKLELEKFIALPENNVYMKLEDAINSIEDLLRNKAVEDCEGAYNCGKPSYNRLFMVNGVKYIGVLNVSYDRHDKTYYYIDTTNFKYTELP